MLHLSLLTAMLKIQSPWRRDIWETAQANKGQDKGKMWAMVMQLNAEPTHEYGSCGADSGDALGWCVRSMHCMRLLVWPHNLTHKLCMSSHFCILTDMLHVLRDQPHPPPPEGTDVSLSARGQLSLGRGKSQSTSLSGERDPVSAQGSMPRTPGTNLLVSGGMHNAANPLYIPGSDPTAD